MLPIIAADNPAGLRRRDAKFVGNVLLGGIGTGPHFSHSQNLCVCEFSSAICLAVGLSAMPNSIFGILSSCCPPQIICTIVVAISIPMSNLMIFRWAWSMECFAYDNVSHGLFETLFKAHGMISAVWIALQYVSLEEALSAKAVDFYSVYRSDTSKTRRLVGRMPWHLAPFFRLGYMIISHLRSPTAVWSGCGWTFAASSAPVKG